jgi:hypothetical protein
MSDRTLEESKAIVEKAIEYHAWSWSDKENADNDAEIVKAADQLVDLAYQASTNNSIAEAVLEVLKVAQIAPVSEITREAYAKRFGQAPAASNGHAPDAQTSAFGQTTTSPPSAPNATQDASSPEPATPVSVESSAAGEDSIEDIFPGYDDTKVKDIKELILASAASGDLSPEEWERVKAYEAKREERKTVLSLEPEFKAPAPEQASSLGGEGAFGPSGDSHDTGRTESSGDLDVPLEQVYAGEAPTRAQQEGLPIPHDADFSGAPNLPLDITGISDEQLSRLGMQFHSYFARGHWLLSQEEGRAALAEHLEREAEHDAYVHAYSLHREQIPEEKRTQPTALEAARKQAEKDAEVAEAVRTWRSRRVNHSVQVRELKALCLGWDKAVWRVDKELDRRGRSLTVARAAS